MGSCTNLGEYGMCSSLQVECSIHDPVGCYQIGRLRPEEHPEVCANCEFYRMEPWCPCHKLTGKPVNYGLWRRLPVSR